MNTPTRQSDPFTRKLERAIRTRKTDQGVAVILRDPVGDTTSLGHFATEEAAGRLRRAVIDAVIATKAAA